MGEYHMRNYRVWLLVAAATLSTSAFVNPASAWEIKLASSYTWEYDIRSQTGPNGFFGPYNVDFGSGIAGTGPGFFAPINGWLGWQAYNFVSGSDAAWQVMYMSAVLDVRVNPAIRIRGEYYIGEWTATTAPFFAGIGTGSPNAPDFGVGDLVRSQYRNNRFPGRQRSFSPGYWRTLWITFDLPWAIITLGKRPAVFGTGLYWNGDDSRSSESTAVTAAYGPLRFQFAFYPARRGSSNSNYPTAPAAGAPATSTAGYYNQDFDKNNGRFWDATMPLVTYRSGPLDMGFTVNAERNRVGNEGIINTPAVRNAQNHVEDHLEWFGAVYVKYYNGRFFFNSEFGWFDLIERTRGPVPLTNNRDTYLENRKVMAEMGTVFGPTKVSLLWAWASGPDRRNGRQIDRNGLRELPGQRSTNYSNTGLFRPYSYVMVWCYGLGTHINGDTQEGYVEDANVYAARIDHAVASNLNLYGSFFWADRASKSGFGWGTIRPVNTAGNVALTYAAQIGAPSVPDTNLGWEADLGIDWKLLENFAIYATFGYWKPGKWFNFACIDKAVPGWATAAAPTWGTNPQRAIDPVWALEMKLIADF